MFLFSFFKHDFKIYNKLDNYIKILYKNLKYLYVLYIMMSLVQITNE
ncbi:MAG: hypothetical protein JW390_50130 [Nitrosopumilus sp.]|nr:hypothetical protein [Candidatus Nitrosopumilus limneticus]